MAADLRGLTWAYVGPPALSPREEGLVEATQALARQMECGASHVCVCVCVRRPLAPDLHFRRPLESLKGPRTGRVARWMPPPLWGPRERRRLASANGLPSYQRSSSFTRPLSAPCLCVAQYNTTTFLEMLPMTIEGLCEQALERAER